MSFWNVDRLQGWKARFLRRGLATVIICSLAPTVVQARCPAGNPAPVVSLSDDLVVVGPFGAEIARLGFMDVVRGNEFVPSRVLDENGNPSGRVPITTNDGQLGFVSANEVLTFRARTCRAERLLMRDIPLTEEDLENTLQAKALVGVTEASVRLQPEGGSTTISVRSAPRSDAPVRKELSLYTAAFVHAATVETVETEDGVRQERWYFIGSRSGTRFTADDQGNFMERNRAPLLGWVNARNLVFWPQRQAVYPESTRAVDKIFDDPGLNTPKAQLEYEDESAPDRTVSVLKMPVLDASRSGTSLRVAFPTLSKDAAPGQTPLSPNPIAGIPGASLTDDVRVLLSRLADASSNVDVLFVIDNTKSMEVYRDDVLRGIAAVNDAGVDLSRTRVAFAMFGDHYSSLSQLEAWGERPPRTGMNPSWTDQMPRNLPFQFWLDNFNQAGQFPDLQDLRAKFGGYYGDPQKDLEETGLYALPLAVNAANWRPRSVRLVFYIGDDASRLAPGQSQSNAAVLAARALKGAEALFVPINVAGRRVDNSNAKWVRQANAVGDAMLEIPGIGGPVTAWKAYGDGGTSTQETVRIAIATLFLVRELSSEAGNITGEDIDARADKYRVSPNQMLDDFLRALTGTDREGLIGLSERNDLLLQGYYPADDAEVFVAVSEQERTALEAAFDLACKSMSSSNPRRSLEQMVDIMVSSFLGETRQSIVARSSEGETLQQFFARTTNLPVDYFAVFGKDRNLKDFIDFVEFSDEAEYRDIQKELCFSAELFEQMGQGAYIARSDYAPPEFNQDYQEFEFTLSNEVKTFLWRWGVGDGMQVIFVPQDFFPRGLNP